VFWVIELSIHYKFYSLAQFSQLFIPKPALNRSLLRAAEYLSIVNPPIIPNLKPIENNVLSAVNPSDIIYKKALEATISAVKRGVVADRAINAGINVIRGTSWLQGKSLEEQKTIESSFRESMLKEFGLEASPEAPSADTGQSNQAKDYSQTEVIDRKLIPKEPIATAPVSGLKPKTEAKPVKAEPIKPKPIERKAPVQAKKATPPPKEKARPVQTQSKPQPLVQEKPPKKRGMGLVSFIVSLFFLGFLAWVSWILYHHEASVENIVIYQNDELVFKEAFPPQTVSVFGIEMELNNAISRKTDPIKIYRAKSGFPFFELNQEVPCTNCDYWTNVQNYDLHHYPDKK